MFESGLVLLAAAGEEKENFSTPTIGALWVRTRRKRSRWCRCRV